MARKTAPWIAAYLNIDIENARAIRAILDGDMSPYAVKGVRQWTDRLYNPPLEHEVMMEAFNILTGGYGVEGIEEKGNYRYCRLEYVNMGDTYAPTIVAKNDGWNVTFHFTSWGDEVERMGL